MQFRRVGSEKSEQVPEKKQDGREHEEKLIRHLRGQTGRIIGGSFPDEPAKNSPDKPETFHRGGKFTLRDDKYPLNSPPNPRAKTPNELKKILILTAGFGEGHNAAARGIREGLGARRFR